MAKMARVGAWPLVLLAAAILLLACGGGGAAAAAADNEPAPAAADGSSSRGDAPSIALTGYYTGNATFYGGPQDGDAKEYNDKISSGSCGEWRCRERAGCMRAAATRGALRCVRLATT